MFLSTTPAPVELRPSVCLVCLSAVGPGELTCCSTDVVKVLQLLNTTETGTVPQTTRQGWYTICQGVKERGLQDKEVPGVASVGGEGRGRETEGETERVSELVID